MANKRVTPKDDPLVATIIQLPRSQKNFLDTLDQSASAFLRNLIQTQMSGHEVEIEKLKNERRQHEAHINVINAQISELEAEAIRKQAASQTREQLLDQAAERILSSLKEIKFNDREIIRLFKNNLDSMNRILGFDSEPVTADELKKITIKKAESKGIRT